MLKRIGTGRGSTGQESVQLPTIDRTAHTSRAEATFGAG